MITTDLVDATGQEIAETNMRRESGPRGDGGVESETTGTGETTPMTGREDPTRMILTRGPVAEVKTIVENLKADLRV